MAKIKVMLCEPQAKPRIDEIDGDRDAVAELVTGTFCLLDLGDGLGVVFDGDGNKKIKDLNRVIDGAPMFGLCIFCRHDGEENLLSLHPAEWAEMEKLLA
ncbi:MAG: hypothetical protein LBK56_07905 [Gracilibacteraceae bacterium]|jgi:hypothetical protein|nr:hypothetical protein [Gracilibacteraceae bacterium]